MASKPLLSVAAIRHALSLKDYAGVLAYSLPEAIALAREVSRTSSSPTPPCTARHWPSSVPTSGSPRRSPSWWTPWRTSTSSTTSCPSAPARCACASASMRHTRYDGYSAVHRCPTLPAARTRRRARAGPRRAVPRLHASRRPHGLRDADRLHRGSRGRRGAEHSFKPVAPSQSHMMNLDHLSGLVAVDAPRGAGSVPRVRRLRGRGDRANARHPRR